MYSCPVCGYDGLDEPPYIDNDVFTGSFEICSCCGFQYGVDDLDKGMTHEAYRNQWIKEGAPWFSRLTIKPSNWNLRQQLMSIGIEV